jgi:4-hydroxy-3-methylbut-2-enyl diphosphate reductase
MLDMNFARQSHDDQARPTDGPGTSGPVVRAAHLGMCFGVREAIARVLWAAARGPLTVLGDLVHNETVLQRLAARGVRVCRELDEVETPTVVITPHGVSERRRKALRAGGHTVLDATCPIVKAAFRSVMSLVRDGYHPVIVGVRDHVEVRGLTEDLSAFDVVFTDADVEALEARPRFGVAAQTTQPVERVHHLVSLLRRRFPSSEVRVAETVCVPTRLRQEAAEALASCCDVTVVVGGAGSNNTRELAATCGRHGGRVFLVQDARDLRPEWCDGAGVAGLTAGTSTPDDVTAGVEERLRAIMSARQSR